MDGGKHIVVQLIQEANRRVHERASTDAETSGMGTTITVARVEDDGSVTFGHVGDSRAYLLRAQRPRAADRRPFARRRARQARRAVGRGRRGASAALGDHASARHRSRRRRRRVLGRRRGRRHLPDLLRRPVGHGRRLDDRGDPARAPGESRRSRPLTRASPPTAPAATTTSPPCCSSSSRRPTRAAEPDEQHARIQLVARRRRHAPPGGPRRSASRGRDAARAGRDSRKRRPRRQGSADGSWRSP